MASAKGCIMSKQSIFCLAEVEAQALDIVNRLKSDGFTNDEISILFPQRSVAKGFVHDRNTPSAETIAEMGVPEHKAERYQEEVKAGSILISVHPGDEDEVSRVKAIFESCGAKDIAATSEARIRRRKERHLSEARR